MCDGSGFNEYYTDVDQTRAYRCSGCFNCQEPEEEIVIGEIAIDPEPLWLGMEAANGIGPQTETISVPNTRKIA